MGADVSVPDTGCYGMAGSFGFERDKFDLSEKVFAHELQSHLATASSETLLMADGFSCRTQIDQNTNRHALHLSQIIKMAIDREDALGTFPVTTAMCANGSQQVWVSPALFIGSGLLAKNRHQPAEEQSILLATFNHFEVHTRHDCALAARSK
jgi:hypothetical protein